jgi:hypothetical protein
MKNYDRTASITVRNLSAHRDKKNHGGSRCSSHLWDSFTGNRESEFSMTNQNQDQKSGQQNQSGQTPGQQGGQPNQKPGQQTQNPGQGGQQGGQSDKPGQQNTPQK